MNRKPISWLRSVHVRIGFTSNAMARQLSNSTDVVTVKSVKNSGQATAFDAMGTCMKLADEYGVGCVAVDNAFHYLWGGGYVIDAANKGYIAYTCCTAALAEVVPFGGKFPTLGTNPHSWAFPTQDAIGFPICVDWATSTVAMGRVQQFLREGKQLPPGSGVDENGKETTDPAKVKAVGKRVWEWCVHQLADRVLAESIRDGTTVTTMRKPHSCAAASYFPPSLFNADWAALLKAAKEISPELASAGAGREG